MARLRVRKRSHLHAPGFFVGNKKALNLKAFLRIYGARGRLEPSATGYVIYGLWCHVVFNLLTNLLTFLFAAPLADRFLGADACDSNAKFLHCRNHIGHGLFFSA